MSLPTLELSQAEYADMERDAFQLFCRPRSADHVPDWAYILPMTGFPEMGAGVWRAVGAGPHAVDRVELFDKDKKHLRTLPMSHPVRMDEGDKIYITYLATVEFVP